MEPGNSADISVTAPLLRVSSNATTDAGTPNNETTSPKLFLPIALLFALAMASTAATAYYAYATILCTDPRHCSGTETSRYAGIVAAATCVANSLSMSALGYLQKLVTLNKKRCLLLWMLCRAMSAVMLLAGDEQNSDF
jgi:hypothetical protein